MSLTQTSSLVKKGTNFFLEFAKSQQFAGILLIVCTLFSLTLSNSHFSKQWLHFLHISVANTKLEWLVNDVFMSFFFLLVGLEIRRELLVGELSNPKTAMLPLSAALGGMVIPAIIYATINGGTSTAAGWAIPTATDIAFAVGILNILGNRIPVAIKVFIAALAVVDDLGAVVVIAIFYSDNVSLFFLILLIILIPIFKLLLKKTRVFFYIIYLFVGVTLFFLLQKANLHTTLSGVLLAAITPYSKQPKQSYLNKVEHLLHKPVNYIIIPAFAIINTAIVLAPSTISNFNLKLFLGVFLGLVIGKPTGITLFSYLACKLKIAELPPSITIKKLFITSILGGIGFTMSIFISLLAFSNHNLIEQSKLAILIASGCAGIVGFVALKIMFKIRV